jgi:predicted nucleotidyltransferase
MSVELILTKLRAQESALRERGVQSLSLFGSQARGQANPASDIDLAATLAPGLSLLDFIGVKHSLEDLLGVQVDLVAEPATRLDLQAAINRDRIRAY